MLPKLLFALRSVLVVCSLSLLATTSRAQTTIHVGPGQTYTTIQSGIDAANTGDTVLVSPGIYNENLNFKGKAITVTSSGGAGSTVIDGGRKPGTATVTFNNGETAASVISGFTIRGGGDTIFSGNGDGGVFVNSAQATIQNNTITANYCHNIDVQFGVAKIINNEITGVLKSNVGSGPDASYCSFGSGIHLGGTNFLINGLGTQIIGNTIESNLTGSAINLWAAQNVLILRNIIRNNSSPDPGSAFTSANSENTVIAQNLIYNNTSQCGSAIAFMNPPMLITNNTIVNNVTAGPGNASECTNIAQIYPAPYSYGYSNPAILIENNIISGSTSYPAVNCSWYDPPSEANQPTFKNNILYNAGGPFFGSYCVDVSGKYNNVAADPQFYGPAIFDYHLKIASPAIDSGDNGALQTYLTMTGQSITTDLDGKPRIQDATGKGCIVDMGAYEVPGTASICGVFETLTSSLNPAIAGQSVTFTAQLTAANGTPTGTMEFFDGANLLSTQPVSGTGSASFTTSALSVGSHNIAATYVPTGNFGSSTASLIQIINADSTTAALTCAPNPINISSTAQFTATVTSAFGVPTGSVSFTDNGAALGTNALAGGIASFTYTGTTAGSHTIKATYLPTGSFAASSATCSEVVNALPTTSTLAVNPANSIYGSPVTLTATVAPVTPPGPSTPTGIVTFYDGAAVLGTSALSNRVATLASSALAAGSHNLTCTYGGSSIYAASSCSPVPVVIRAAATALSLISSKSPAAYLTPVTFTATLTINGQAAGAGNIVQLSLNGQTINLTTIAGGSASYNIATLPPDSYPVVASFAATNNLLSSSASLTEVITAAPTNITLTGTPNPANLNQSVDLTATVSSQSTPVGQGSVNFYDGGTSLGSSPLSPTGIAKLSATFNTLGVHNLTAVYGGTANFLGSTSAVFEEQIIPGDFSITATPASTSLYTGQTAAIQVNVASLQGFNQPLAFACSGLPANATCSFTPATLPQGQGSSFLVIQTAAPHKATAAAASLFGALILLLLPGWKRRRGLVAECSAALLALCIAFGVSGCGGAGSISGGTPPGTYKVAVTASTTDAGTPLAHSAIVTVTVKSLF